MVNLPRLLLAGRHRQRPVRAQRAEGGPAGERARHRLRGREDPAPAGRRRVHNLRNLAAPAAHPGCQVPRLRDYAMLLLNKTYPFMAYYSVKLLLFQDQIHLSDEITFVADLTDTAIISMAF